MHGLDFDASLEKIYTGYEGKPDILQHPLENMEYKYGSFSLSPRDYPEIGALGVARSADGTVGMAMLGVKQAAEDGSLYDGKMICIAIGETDSDYYLSLEIEIMGAEVDTQTEIILAELGEYYKIDLSGWIAAYDAGELSGEGSPAGEPESGVI
jgi:hypothetical protein